MRKKRIDLERFAAGTSRLSPEYCSLAACAFALKLKEYGHAKPARLSVEGAFNETVNVTWNDPDPRTTNTFANNAVEMAGECVGIALCEKLTDYNVIERSFIGTGFDFWLGRKGDFLFQRKARLELSATESGGTAAFDARLRKKVTQVDNGSGASFGEAYIIVSDLRKPMSKVVKHA